MYNFRGRDFITLNDYTREELMEIISLAVRLKEQQKKGVPHHLLAGKTLGMIFEKSSTRTRVSFEVAMYQLGGYALFLSAQDLQIGRGEPVKDTARVLASYLDGIMIRTFSHDMVKELAHFSEVPVINGLTDLLHPCQVVADLQTIIENKGKLKGLKMGYIGDGNNVSHSLLLGASLVGMDVIVATPPGYEPVDEVVRQSQENGRKSDAKIELTTDPALAAKGADVLYTDVWASMGQESEKLQRLKDFKGFQINQSLLTKANNDAVVLHCLPAHRGEEITDEVLEGKQSVIFEQAENRLHSQKAILSLLMGEED